MALRQGKQANLGAGSGPPTKGQQGHGCLCPPATRCSILPKNKSAEP